MLREPAEYPSAPVRAGGRRDRAAAEPQVAAPVSVVVAGPVAVAERPEAAELPDAPTAVPTAVRGAQVEPAAEEVLERTAAPVAAVAGPPDGATASRTRWAPWPERPAAPFRGRLTEATAGTRIPADHLRVPAPRRPEQRAGTRIRSAAFPAAGNRTRAGRRRGRTTAGRSARTGRRATGQRDTTGPTGRRWHCPVSEALPNPLRPPPACPPQLWTDGRAAVGRAREGPAPPGRPEATGAASGASGGTEPGPMPTADRRSQRPGPPPQERRPRACRAWTDRPRPAPRRGAKATRERRVQNSAAAGASQGAWRDGSTADRRPPRPPGPAASPRRRVSVRRPGVPGRRTAPLRRAGPVLLRHPARPAGPRRPPGSRSAPRRGDTRRGHARRADSRRTVARRERTERPAATSCPTARRSPAEVPRSAARRRRRRFRRRPGARRPRARSGPPRLRRRRRTGSAHRAVPGARPPRSRRSCSGTGACPTARRPRGHCCRRGHPRRRHRMFRSPRGRAQRCQWCCPPPTPEPPRRFPACRTPGEL